jgi:hypothetical protein
VALGAGVLGSTIRAGAETPRKPGAATKTPPAAQGYGPLNTKNCVGHNTTSGFGNARDRKQLQLETCCVYLKDVLEHGFENAQSDPKTLLKPFMTQLADEAQRDALMDYCYVQFDLTEVQLKSLREFTRKMLVPPDKK